MKRSGIALLLMFLFLQTGCQRWQPAPQPVCAPVYYCQPCPQACAPAAAAPCAPTITRPTLPRQ